MYFTNISYKELQEFHDKVHINVRINLQDTLNNGLFKIVTIGDLLKVFPLFYTDRIESSNSNDKIIILQTCSMDPNYYEKYYRYNLLIMGKLI